MVTVYIQIKEDVVFVLFRFPVFFNLRERGPIQAVSVYVRNIKKYMGILKSLNMANLYRGMSKLKLK